MERPGRRGKLLRGGNDPFYTRQFRSTGRKQAHQVRPSIPSTSRTTSLSVCHSRLRSSTAPARFVPRKSSSSGGVNWRGVRRDEAGGSESTYGPCANAALEFLQLSIGTLVQRTVVRVLPSVRRYRGISAFARSTRPLPPRPCQSHRG